jgi:CubicO group peptidase (beta-lactamase class C family)
MFQWIPSKYETPTQKVGRAFYDYARGNRYRNASLGVLYGDRLVYASDKYDIGNVHAKASPAIHPILGLSKTLTAVGILKLAEKGSLDLDWAVFGKGGVFAELTGPDGKIFDPRVRQIRIRHLLHHTGGWDESIGPVYDPLLNTQLLESGVEVVDIRRELGLKDEPDQWDIIKYMLGQPLQFEPGTKAHESNFGYCILGRILEEVVGESYEYWIQKNVLQPAGMWHTRIGPSPNNMDQDVEYTNAETVDAALGWYSNVYDLARLFICLFKSGVNDEFALLAPETLDKMMRRPDKIYYPQHNQRWMSMGFTIEEDGTFYLENTEKKPSLHVDVLFYHKQSPQYPIIKAQDADSAFSFDYTDDSTIIFIGYTDQYHKHMRGLAKSVLGLLTPEFYLTNALLKDLGDNHLLTDSHDVLVKYKLEEHHLLAYTQAMRICSYYPTWIHGYHYQGHTYYTTIFQRATEISQLYYQVFASASKEKLLKVINEFRAQQFDVSLLQSFVSSSHDDQVTHVVIMTVTDSKADETVSKFSESYDNYMMELGRHEEEGFRPVVQSIELYNNELMVDYLLHRNLNAVDEPEARSFIDLSYNELHALTEKNAMDGYILAYLDTFQLSPDDQPRFSAIFRYQKFKEWLLQDDVNFDRLRAQVDRWNIQDYMPKLLVGYVDNKELKYAGLWVTDNA